MYICKYVKKYVYIYISSVIIIHLPIYLFTDSGSASIDQIANQSHHKQSAMYHPPIFLKHPEAIGFFKPFP